VLGTLSLSATAHPDKTKWQSTPNVTVFYVGVLIPPSCAIENQRGQDGLFTKENAKNFDSYLLNLAPLTTRQ
jgi:hypothetical protein